MKQDAGAPVVVECTITEEPQAEFFPRDFYPDRPELAEMVKRGFNHTAKNLARNDERKCQEIVVDVLMGMSSRTIARKHRVSRNSIVGIYRALEARGIVEPLKKKLGGLLGEIITLGLEDYRDALAEGRLHPSQIPVPMGIYMTHKALIDGDPTVRVESGKPSELTVDSVKAFYENLKRAKPGTEAIEAESTVEGGKPQ